MKDQERLGRGGGVGIFFTRDGNKGEIKEMGTHEELLSLEGYYFKLYQLQFDKKTKVA